MKRSEFVLRLAVENKFAYVSDSIDVFQIPNNINETVDTDVIDVIKKPIISTDVFKEPVIKPLNEAPSETSTQCEQENAFIKVSTNTQRIESILSPRNNHSYASSPTTKKLCLQETYHPDLMIRKMPLAESLTEKSTSPNNTFVKIIPDVILKPGTSGDTTSAQYDSDLTSTVPTEYDIYNFCEECDQMDIETGNKYTCGSIVPDIEINSNDLSGFEAANNNKNITLLAPPILQPEFFENSPNFKISNENTDGFDICPVDKETDCNGKLPEQIKLLENNLGMNQSTFLQDFDNFLLSDTDDEYVSSGDEFIPPTDVDRSSSDSGSEISTVDVHKTNSKNTQENVTIQTENKDTIPSDHPKWFDRDRNTFQISNTNICPETSTATNQQYNRKQSARERPTICPLCFDDVITHFPRHLTRHHPKDPEVKRMLSLKPNSKERLELVSAFRKRGYFILKTEKDISHPVRSSKDSETDHFVCNFCLELYNKKTLYRHVKVCKSKPLDVTNPGKNCLSKSQTFMATKNHEFLRTSRLKTEVFETMRADSVSNVAKSDPLICLYGEVLLAKHKRQQMATVISNKIREMAKMLMAIRSMHDNIKGLFDILKPEMFATLVSAVKVISGYNENEKSFRAPSLALHMGTNLKIVCNVAFKLVIERKQIPNISWENRDEKKSDIKDLRKLIEAHWCNEISSLALKDLKERQWQKPVQLPLTEDILLFKKYIEEISENAYESLQKGINIKENYKKLTECVLAQTIMFNRKRVGDVQYLKIETYRRENVSITQKAFSESLTDLEKILCGQFKRVITDGKGSKPVPILFSKRTQRYITYLLNIRETTNIVPKSNPYLFANPGVENKWIRGDYIFRMIAKKCGAKHPVLLTSTKFRKHIATTLQLMNMGEDEMEQVATFMGHTKKTHSQFYRLPQDLYQTAKVVKVLLLLEKGKGKEFRGKNLEEINLDKDYYNSDASDEEDDHEVGNTKKKSKLQIIDDPEITKQVGEQTRDEKICNTDDKRGKIKEEKAKGNTGDLRDIYTKTKDEESDNKEEEEKDNEDDLRERNSEIQKKAKGASRLKPITGRSRWTSAEKKLVENYFRKHIKNKITPKKHECDQFFSKYGDKMIKKDWVKVKTFVYNTFRQK